MDRDRRAHPSRGARRPAGPRRHRRDDRGAVDRGIVTHVTDGFVAGDRGALQLTCTYPTGGQVVENALVEIRDGRIARWSGVQAWDE